MNTKVLLLVCSVVFNSLNFVVPKIFCKDANGRLVQRQNLPVEFQVKLNVPSDVYSEEDLDANIPESLYSYDSSIEVNDYPLYGQSNYVPQAHSSYNRITDVPQGSEYSLLSQSKNVPQTGNYQSQVTNAPEEFNYFSYSNSNNVPQAGEFVLYSQNDNVPQTDYYFNQNNNNIPQETDSEPNGELMENVVETILNNLNAYEDPSQSEQNNILVPAELDSFNIPSINYNQPMENLNTAYLNSYNPNLKQVPYEVMKRRLSPTDATEAEKLKENVLKQHKINIESATVKTLHPSVNHPEEIIAKHHNIEKTEVPVSTKYNLNSELQQNKNAEINSYLSHDNNYKFSDNVANQQSNNIDYAKEGYPENARNAIHSKQEVSTKSYRILQDLIIGSPSETAIVQAVKDIPQNNYEFSSEERGQNIVNKNKSDRRNYLIKIPGTQNDYRIINSEPHISVLQSFENDLPSSSLMNNFDNPYSISNVYQSLLTDSITPITESPINFNQNSPTNNIKQNYLFNRPFKIISNLDNFYVKNAPMSRSLTDMVDHPRNNNLKTNKIQKYSSLADLPENPLTNNFKPISKSQTPTNNLESTTNYGSTPASSTTFSTPTTVNKGYTPSDNNLYSQHTNYEPSSTIAPYTATTYNGNSPSTVNSYNPSNNYRSPNQNENTANHLKHKSTTSTSTGTPARESSNPKITSNPNLNNINNNYYPYTQQREKINNHNLPNNVNLHPSKGKPYSSNINFDDSANDVTPAYNTITPSHESTNIDNVNKQRETANYPNLPTNQPYYPYSMQFKDNTYATPSYTTTPSHGFQTTNNVNKQRETANYPHLPTNSNLHPSNSHYQYSDHMKFKGNPYGTPPYNTQPLHESLSTVNVNKQPETINIPNLPNMNDLHYPHSKGFSTIFNISVNPDQMADTSNIQQEPEIVSQYWVGNMIPEGNQVPSATKVYRIIYSGSPQYLNQNLLSQYLQNAYGSSVLPNINPESATANDYYNLYYKNTNSNPLYYQNTVGKYPKSAYKYAVYNVPYPSYYSNNVQVPNSYQVNKQGINSNLYEKYPYYNYNYNLANTYASPNVYNTPLPLTYQPSQYTYQPYSSNGIQESLYPPNQSYNRRNSMSDNHAFSAVIQEIIKFLQSRTSALSIALYNRQGQCNDNNFEKCFQKYIELLYEFLANASDSQNIEEFLKLHLELLSNWRSKSNVISMALYNKVSEKCQDNFIQCFKKLVHEIYNHPVSIPHQPAVRHNAEDEPATNERSNYFLHLNSKLFKLLNSMNTEMSLALYDSSDQCSGNFTTCVKVYIKKLYDYLNSYDNNHESNPATHKPDIGHRRILL